MLGIHHVTAIAGDPVKNLSFYTRDLGLRFVKKTVNFDDPSACHFDYGDEGRGSVHHIAFRAADDVQQAKMTEKLIRKLPGRVKVGQPGTVTGGKRR
jgi:hypothetical protein